MSTQKNELYHILSPEWLKTNPLPEDGEFENNYGKWLVSSRRGRVTPGWNEYPYRTQRTDLPPEAYITPPTDSGREGETPETDRATKYQVRVYPHQNGTIETVRVELAKQLERQRDAALAQLEALRRDGERLDWLSRFFSFENVDYSDVEQASYWGWNISDDALLQALGGTKGMPDPIPTLRAAIDSAQHTKAT